MKVVLTVQMANPLRVLKLVFFLQVPAHYYNVMFDSLLKVGDSNDNNNDNDNNKYGYFYIIIQIGIHKS